MDLAIYISELLGQRGEIRIPGVGYFAQVRVNGYYNDQEHTFYPPGHKIEFDPQIIESDDSLAEYIAGKKNISILSARYFVDKYLGTLKQDILKQVVEIADLGYLFSEDSKILFKPGNASNEADAAFFGFRPVKLNRAGGQPIIADLPVTADMPGIPVPPQETYYTPPAAAPQEILTDQPVSKPQVFSPHEQDQQHLQYIEQEIKKPNLPVIILFAVTILGLIFFGIYLYNPELFGSKPDTTTVVKPVDNPKPKPVAATADTSKKAGIVQVKDTTATAITKVADTAMLPRYELIGGSFKTQKQADLAIKNYKTLGVDAKVVTDAPGKRIKLTLGTFKTNSEVQNARLMMIKEKKVSKDIYPFKINPKK